MKNWTLEEFASQSASKEPVPGGGGVSAACGALAASLGEMVTRLTIGKKKFLEYTEELTDIRKELSILREELLDAIEKDAEAFRPLSTVYSLPKDSEGYEEKMESCLKAAAASPFEILKKTCRVIELDERLAPISSKLAISDAATSVMLAEGVLYGAHINVLVNTRLMKDRDYAEKLQKEADDLLQEYAERALKVYRYVERRLHE